MNGFSLNRVMGRELRPVTLDFTPGMQVIGTHDEVGHAEFIALLCGARAPRRGRVTLRERTPCNDPELRTHIASLWPVEQLPKAKTARDSVKLLGFSATRTQAITALVESLASPSLLDMHLPQLSPIGHRLVFLAIALSTEDPWAFALHEPLANLDPKAQEIVLEQLARHAKSLPVVLLTANASLARRFDGPALELDAGWFRQVSETKSQWHQIRVVGVGLRALTTEFAKRKTIRSLCFRGQIQEGQEELVLEARDVRQLSLDIVRVTHEMGIRLILLQTTGLPQ